MKGTKVTLYDTSAVKLFTVLDSGGYPEEIFSMGGSYYLACCPDNEEEMEMRVFKQSIYNRKGQLINNSKFGFEQIYEEKGRAIVSVIDPHNEFGLLFGVFNLINNQFLIPPEYTEMYLLEIRHSLTEIPDKTCDYYFKSNYSGEDLLWDCEGRVFSGVAEYVSGEGLEVEKLKNPEKHGGSSWMVTHIIEDTFNDLTMGDIGYINASIEDTYGDLIIYKARHEYHDEFFTYGLGYEDSAKLILAPEFRFIRFDKAQQTIELNHKNKTYIFPLSRYEK